MCITANHWRHQPQHGKSKRKKNERHQPNGKRKKKNVNWCDGWSDCGNKFRRRSAGAGRAFVPSWKWYYALVVHAESARVFLVVSRKSSRNKKAKKDEEDAEVQEPTETRLLFGGKRINTKRRENIFKPPKCRYRVGAIRKGVVRVTSLFSRCFSVSFTLPVSDPVAHRGGGARIGGFHPRYMGREDSSYLE